jgi:hypothetical protein
MQSSPSSRYFLPLWSKYSPQHPVIKFNLCSSLRVRDQVSHPYRIISTIMVLYILFFHFFFEKTGRQEALNRMVESIPRI